MNIWSKSNKNNKDSLYLYVISVYLSYEYNEALKFSMYLADRVSQFSYVCISKQM